MPVQLPGLGWVEITYSRLECLNGSRSQFSSEQHSNDGEKGCHHTFVFVGDLISMANSVHLTSYQPRFSMYFIAHIPDMLERFFTCAFHVSMVLALLNSLPVSYSTIWNWSLHFPPNFAFICLKLHNQPTWFQKDCYYLNFACFLLGMIWLSILMS